MLKSESLCVFTMGVFMVDWIMCKGVILEGVQRGEANRSTLVSAGKPKPGDFS